MAFYGSDQRDYEARRRREKGKNVNEIGPIPECADLALRNELEANSARWLREILPDVYFAEFSAKQLEIIDVVWNALVSGAWKNVEAYRGFGKTSLLSGLLFKALCQGVIRRAIYVTAEGGASVGRYRASSVSPLPSVGRDRATPGPRCRASSVSSLPSVGRDRATPGPRCRASSVSAPVGR